jgi:SAM-dependent methyltransferase
MGEKMIRRAYKNFRTYCFPSLEYHLRQLLKGYRSFVDLGCGPNSPVQKFSKRYRCLGVDAAEESIRQSREKGIFTEYLVADITKTGIASKSYDVAISLDVINLNEKSKSEKIISEMERIASKRAIIFVPNGKVEEPKEIKERSESRYKSNYEYLKYRSSWTAAEMRQRGYKVIGINGLKWLRKGNAMPRIRPTPVGALISDMTQPVVQFMPSKAFHLLCYRDLDKEE